MSGVFAVTMNVVVFVQGGVRVIVAGMIRVVGVVCFRSGVITMVLAGMVGVLMTFLSLNPVGVKMMGKTDQDKTV